MLLAFGAAGPMSRDEWAASHVALLAGAILLWPAAVQLQALLPRPDRLRSVAGGAVALGLFALAGQFAIDLAVGELAASPAERAGLFSTIRSSPLLALTFYLLGPSLTFVGLFSHGVGLARSRRTLSGTLLMAAVLLIGTASATRPELFLVGYLVLLASLAPLGWRARADRARDPIA